MKVQVYGSGCEKCKKLAANVQTAAETLGVRIELEKVTDINAITDAGIMMTPALAVDGRIVSVGKVLSPEDAAKFLKPSACSCGGTCEVKEAAAPEPEKPSCGCGGSAPAEESGSCCCCGGGKNGKKILTAVLLLFVVASVAFMAVREINDRKTAGASAETAVKSPVPASKNVLSVYYFHGTRRCVTCSKIEQLARAAMESGFAGAVKKGELVFRSVNVDEQANAHFVNDFKLASSTVVMERNGKFEKFDDVWNLVGEPEKFTAYLQKGAAKMMEASR